MGAEPVPLLVASMLDLRALQSEDRVAAMATWLQQHDTAYDTDATGEGIRAAWKKVKSVVKEAARDPADDVCSPCWRCRRCAFLACSLPCRTPDDMCHCVAPALATAVVLDLNDEDTDQDTCHRSSWPDPRTVWDPEWIPSWMIWDDYVSLPDFITIDQSFAH